MAIHLPMVPFLLIRNITTLWGVAENHDNNNDDKTRFVYIYEHLWAHRCTLIFTSMYTRGRLCTLVYTHHSGPDPTQKSVNFRAPNCRIRALQSKIYYYHIDIFLIQIALFLTIVFLYLIILTDFLEQFL